MAHHPYCAPEFSASRGLAYLAGFFAAGLGLSGLYAVAGVGLPCPFRLLTGWDCPLCGSTRMGGSLLHLDVTAALAFNPLVFAGLVLLTVLAGLWAVELLGGPPVRLPERLGVRLRRVHPTRWLVIGLAAAAAYTLLRNLL